MAMLPAQTPSSKDESTLPACSDIYNADASFRVRFIQGVGCLPSAIVMKGPH